MTCIHKPILHEYPHIHPIYHLPIGGLHSVTYIKKLSQNFLKISALRWILPNLCDSVGNPLCCSKEEKHYNILLDQDWFAWGEWNPYVSMACMGEPLFGDQKLPCSRHRTLNWRLLLDPQIVFHSLPRNPTGIPLGSYMVSHMSNMNIYLAIYMMSKIKWLLNVWSNMNTCVRNIICPKKPSLSVKFITVTITILLLKSSVHSLMVYLMYVTECTMVNVVYTRTFV